MTTEEALAQLEGFIDQYHLRMRTMQDPEFSALYKVAKQLINEVGPE